MTDAPSSTFIESLQDECDRAWAEFVASVGELRGVVPLGQVDVISAARLQSEES